MSSEDCAVRRGFSLAFWKKKKKKPNQTHKISDCVMELLYSYVKTINGDRLIRIEFGYRYRCKPVDSYIFTIFWMKNSLSLQR